MSEKDKERGEIQTKQSSGSTNFAMRSDLAFPKNWKMSTFLKSIFMLTALKPTPGIGCTMEAQSTVSNSTQCGLFIGEQKNIYGFWSDLSL